MDREKPAAVIFEDYNKGVLTGRVIDEVIRMAGERKIFTAVDPKKKNFSLTKMYRCSNPTSGRFAKPCTWNP